ncbi:MAG: DUF5362 family protein [Chloroflexota bacterium]|nr:DUF5362 family protein [Chloroflexota bacterium]
MFCNKCGTENSEDNSFCQRCGANLTLPVPSEAIYIGADKEMQAPIVGKMANDMKFVGLFSIIGGALYCLGIIYALVGVPMIICGLRLREAADNFAYYEKSKDTTFLERGFEKQGICFFILKILIIISLVLFAIIILGYIAFFGFVFAFD